MLTIDIVKKLRDKMRLNNYANPIMVYNLQEYKEIRCG